MTPAHVEELRRKLVGETEFANIWDYFLTHFAEKPAFLELGRWAAQEPLLGCILECYKRANPEFVAGKLVNFRPREVPEFKLIHGAFQMQGNWSGFVYFTDLDMGLVCFANPKTGKSIFGRFHTDPKAVKSNNSAGVH